ncbi:MAG: NADH-quinone oxidoreductase subunit I [Thermoproteota archaeon]|nr:MAG: NADH-quinone oxidoreductase subunit I [Candidatus Korarchaeota archaeon]
MELPKRVVHHIEALLTGAKYLVVKPRMTVMYPEEAQILPEGYRGMPKFNREKCRSCSLCARICPANAIKMYTVEVEGEKKKKYPGINYNRCIFCGFCVDICPAGALEFTDIHDYASYSLEDLVFKPDRFAEGPPPRPFKPKLVKPMLDEEVGLKYVPG